MPPKTEKTAKEPIITVHIVPGKVSEYHKKLYRAFWTRLIATIPEKLKAEGEGKK